MNQPLQPDKPLTTSPPTENGSFQELTAEPAWSLQPKNFNEAMEIARVVADSDLVPNDFKGKPSNVVIGMQMGMELGLPPLQALQNIAVINGRPSIWGDLLPALARSAADFEYMDETFDDDSMTAICKVKRRNQPEQSRSFSQLDAQSAKLWGKTGPWQQYPKRMLQMRARAWAVRDTFPDVLRGISVREEVIDIDPVDYSDVTPEPTKMTKPIVSQPKAKKPAKQKTEKPADDTPPETEETKPPEVAPSGEGFTKGMINMATKKLERIVLPESALFAHFEVGGWDDFDRSRINEILTWIDGQAG